jgi:hypothetical protein
VVSPTAARAVHEGEVDLKALAMGLCALVLCATPVAAQAGTEADFGAQLARHVASMRKSTSVIRFFEHHRWLLSDPRFQEEAKLRLRIARNSLAATRAKAARARKALARAERRRHARMLAALAPAPAICKVFGSYCRQALQVARCESGYSTNAQNGQYLGLFQMGTSERRLFGHGATAIEQARAAYRYFVRSGRDWSPWSCKPWS